MKEIKFNNRQEWLNYRINGIGASECSAIIGCNPYMTNEQLWDLKTGKNVAEDISEKEYVKYGLEAEKYLRELFALDYPQYEVKYKEDTILLNDKHEFIFATLDGELIEKSTGRFGVLEIKTTNILQGMQKEKWKEGMPQNYYTQCLWQLLVTDYDFVVLTAQLKSKFKDEVYKQTKHYKIERADVLEDIEYLKEQAIKFWDKVKSGEKPNLILPTI